MLHALLLLSTVALMAAAVAARAPDKENNRFTIVHTTDMHGWIMGHRHSTTLDADAADLHSFLQHLQTNSSFGEVLYFSSGDLTQGTGISDASPIPGQYVLDIVAEHLPYAGVSVGNHDVGEAATADYLFRHWMPHNRTDAFVTMNVFFTGDPGEPQRFGSACRVLETQSGIRILVLGFLGSFDHKLPNVLVMPVQEAIRQPAFHDALTQPRIDMIVCVNHISVDDAETAAVFQAIRSVHPRTPLLLLSGHQHRQVVKWFDDAAFGVESGRYLEVVSAIQFEVASPAAGQPAVWHDFTHQFINMTRSLLEDFSGVSASRFPTPTARRMEADMQAAFKKLGLGRLIGCLNETYYNVGYTPDWAKKQDNLYRLLVSEIVPNALASALPGNVVFMVNPFSLRAPMYAGQVIEDDIMSIDPFQGAFFFFEAVPGADILQLLGVTRDTKRFLYIATVDPATTYTWLLLDYDKESVNVAQQQLWGELRYAAQPHPRKACVGKLVAEFVQKTPCK